MTEGQLANSFVMALTVLSSRLMICKRWYPLWNERFSLIVLVVPRLYVSSFISTFVLKIISLFCKRSFQVDPDLTIQMKDYFSNERPIARRYPLRLDSFTVQRSQAIRLSHVTNQPVEKV